MELEKETRSQRILREETKTQDRGKELSVRHLACVRACVREWVGCDETLQASEVTCGCVGRTRGEKDRHSNMVLVAKFA